VLLSCLLDSITLREVLMSDASIASAIRGHIAEETKKLAAGHNASAAFVAEVLEPTVQATLAELKAPGPDSITDIYLEHIGKGLVLRFGSRPSSDGVLSGPRLEIRPDPDGHVQVSYDTQWARPGTPLPNWEHTSRLDPAAPRAQADFEIHLFSFITKGALSYVDLSLV
jgi:hypothetical protein